MNALAIYSVLDLSFKSFIKWRALPSWPILQYDIIERSAIQRRVCLEVIAWRKIPIIEAKSASSFQKFGALYSWEFAKKLVPKGWRLPTDGDWQQLEREIGISKESVNTIGWRGINNEVNELKQNGKTGFNIVFGGWKTDYGDFRFQEQHANFWCADSYDNERAFERLFGVKNQKIGREYGNKGCGFSVRYVKDNDTKK